VTPLARQARQLTEYPVGDLACFNVDFSREFRYCLETGVDPTPTSELSTLQLAVPLTETTGDAYEELSVADETVKGPPGDILTAVQDAIDEHDPDVLVCSTSDIVPTLYEMASTAGVDEFTLSRWPDVDYQQLASRSTYASYGQVGHSPARYNVPGRAIVDESNTFFYGETNLDGILDLVSRSKKAPTGDCVGEHWERPHRDPDLRSPRPRRAGPVELLAPRALQVDGDAPRRRPWWIHLRSRGRPPRRRSRTRLFEPIP